MKLYRLKLKPRSPWLTPWHAHTLAGYLCWTHARTLGEEALLRDVITPALRGDPSFVLSDAFPGDLLPAPTILHLRDWAATDRKHVRRARWLQPESFNRLQSGRELSATELLLDDVFHNSAHLRNTLDRLTDTTGEAGSLFSLGETVFNKKSALLRAADYLSVYARVAEGFENTCSGSFIKLRPLDLGLMYQLARATLILRHTSRLWTVSTKRQRSQTDSFAYRHSSLATKIQLTDFGMPLRRLGKRDRTWDWTMFSKGRWSCCERERVSAATRRNLLDAQFRWMNFYPPTTVRP